MRVAALGFTPILAPMLAIRPLPARTRAATASKATVKVVTPRRPATPVKTLQAVATPDQHRTLNTLQPRARRARNSTAALEFEP